MLCVNHCMLHRFVNAFFFHSIVANQYSPYIGTGFWNHEHPNHWYCIGPKYYRYVKTKTQYDSEPHPTEQFVLVNFCAFVKKYDDTNSQECKRYVTIDIPGQRNICAKPMVLWYHAHNNAPCSKKVNPCRYPVIALNIIAFALYIVKNYIKQCHCYRGNPFTDAK